VSREEGERVAKSHTKDWLTRVVEEEYPGEPHPGTLDVAQIRRDLWSLYAGLAPLLDARGRTIGGFRSTRKIARKLAGFYSARLDELDWEQREQPGHEPDPLPDVETILSRPWIAARREAADRLRGEVAVYTARSQHKKHGPVVVRVLGWEVTTYDRLDERIKGAL
jgi:hypothetical protein